MNADIMLDGGDAVAEWNLPVLVFRAREFSAMRQLGYDGMAVGNWDFHESPWAMRAKAGPDAPPMLAVNLLRRGRNPFCLNMLAQLGMIRDLDPRPVVPDGPWPISSSLILTRRGLRIGVIGLMLDMSVPEKRIEQRLGGLRRFLLKSRFRDPEEAVAEEVARVRRQTELVILVSHAGLETNLAISEKVQGLSLILSGHTHRSHPLTLDGTTPVIHGYVRSGRRANCAAVAVTISTSAPHQVLSADVYDLRSLERVAAVSVESSE